MLGTGHTKVWFGFVLFLSDSILQILSLQSGKSPGSATSCLVRQGKFSISVICLKFPLRLYCHDVIYKSVNVCEFEIEAPLLVIRYLFLCAYLCI